MLVTNAHVVSQRPVDLSAGAVHPDEAVVTFAALRAADPSMEFGIASVLFESPPEALDVVVATLTAPLAPDGGDSGGRRGSPRPARHAGARRRASLGSRPVVSSGEFLGHMAPRLRYRAATEGGSSGSPVFNADWKLVGLHHAGGRSHGEAERRAGRLRGERRHLNSAIAARRGRGGSQADVAEINLWTRMPAIRRLIVFLALSVFFGPVPGAQAPAARTLDIYVIDVEGGEATLFVSPSGESLLVDTGWPGFDGRDADRIAVVAKQAGIKQIDYLVATHFHAQTTWAARLRWRRGCRFATSSTMGRASTKVNVPGRSSRGTLGGAPPPALHRGRAGRHDPGRRPGRTSNRRRWIRLVKTARGRRWSQSAVRGVQASGPRDHQSRGRRRRSPFGERLHHLRPVSHCHHGRPDLEQGIRPDVPEQQAR